MHSHAIRPSLRHWTRSSIDYAQGNQTRSISKQAKPKKKATSFRRANSKAQGSASIVSQPSHQLTEATPVCISITTGSRPKRRAAGRGREAGS